MCKEAGTFLSNVPCDEDIFDMCNIIASELGLPFPKSIPEVQEFYVTIREVLRSLIFNWVVKQTVIFPFFLPFLEWAIWFLLIKALTEQV